MYIYFLVNHKCRVNVQNFFKIFFHWIRNSRTFAYKQNYSYKLKPRSKQQKPFKYDSQINICWCILLSLSFIIRLSKFVQFKQNRNKIKVSTTIIIIKSRLDLFLGKRRKFTHTHTSKTQLGDMMTN